jgi:hypothetical protein
MPADVVRLFQQTTKAFGRPSVLVEGCRYDFGPINTVMEDAFIGSSTSMCFRPDPTVKKVLKYFPETTLTRGGCDAGQLARVTEPTSPA